MEVFDFGSLRRFARVQAEIERGSRDYESSGDSECLMKFRPGNEFRVADSYGKEVVAGLMKCLIFR